ncbi:hypothetical protein PTI98_012714 [Pleurotus ostreatus]|nr:hypothetical protein PTI98_012714 [Pleurotus ostreatus]
METTSLKSLVGPYDGDALERITESPLENSGENNAAITCHFGQTNQITSTTLIGVYTQDITATVVNGLFPPYQHHPSARVKYVPPSSTSIVMFTLPSVKSVLAIVLWAIATSIRDLNAVADNIVTFSLADSSVPTFVSEVAEVLTILIQVLINALLFAIASAMLWLLKHVKFPQFPSFGDLDTAANCSPTDVDSGNPELALLVPPMEPVFQAPSPSEATVSRILPQPSGKGTVFTRPDTTVFQAPISPEVPLLPTPQVAKEPVFSRPKETTNPAIPSRQATVAPLPPSFGQVVFTRPKETAKQIAVPSEATAAPITRHTFGTEIVFTRPAPSTSDTSSCPPTPTDNEIDATVHVVEGGEVPLDEDETIKKELPPVTDKLLLVGRRERVSPMLMPFNGRTAVSNFPIRDLIIDAKLGQGTFGSVYRTVDLQTSTMYAVKVIEKDDDEKEHGYQRRCVRREIYHQSDMSTYGALFAEVQGAMETPTHYFLVQTYYKCGDLSRWLYRRKRFSVERTVVYVAQIVHMIELMQQNGILHRDIKPANILVDKDGYLHMTDFGLSHQYAFIDRRRGLYNYPQYELWKPAGTPEYAPPEMSLGQIYNLWVDFYSLGIVTYELLTGELPRRDVLKRRGDRVEAFEHPNFSEIPPNHEQYLNHDALDFIKSLVYDPRSPYCMTTIAGIKAHPFLRNAPWYEIENNQIFDLKAKPV